MNNKYINIHGIPKRSMGTVRFTVSTHKFSLKKKIQTHKLHTRKWLKYCINLTTHFINIQIQQLRVRFEQFSIKARAHVQIWEPCVRLVISQTTQQNQFAQQGPGENIIIWGLALKKIDSELLTNAEGYVNFQPPEIFSLQENELRGFS